MNPLSLIRRGDPAATATAAEIALGEWKAVNATLNKQHASAQLAAESTNARISRGAAIEIQLAALDEALITAKAAVETGDGTADRVRALERQRATLQSEAHSAFEDARIAKLVLVKHSATVQDIVRRQRVHFGAFPRLALAIVGERTAASMPAYLKARDAFFDAAVRTFALARVGDDIAQASGFGNSNR